MQATSYSTVREIMDSSYVAYPRNYFMVKVANHIHGFNGEICRNAANVLCGSPQTFREMNCERGRDKCFDMYLFADPKHFQSDWRKRSFMRLLNYPGSLNLEPTGFGDFILFWTYKEHQRQDHNYGNYPVLVGLYVVDKVEKAARYNQEGRPTPEYTIFPRTGMDIRINIDPPIPADDIVARPYPWTATLTQSEMGNILDLIRDRISERARQVRLQDPQNSLLQLYNSQLTIVDRIVDEFEHPTILPMPKQVTPKVTATGQMAPLADPGATTPQVQRASGQQPETTFIPATASPSVVDHLAQLAREEQLHYPSDLLTGFHISMANSPLVVLSGQSGTGKTQLGRIFALAEGARYSLVKVQPDWVSPSYLWGIYDYLRHAFVPTPFAFMVREAADEWEKANAEGRKPQRYVICLDEMNLAHVEYYLADILSAMEQPPHEQWVEIYSPGLEDGHFPTRLRLTPNISLIGTINVDETTHSLSPKVLDRAHVVRLDRVDLEEMQTLLAGARDKEVVEFVFRHLKSIQGIMGGDPTQQFGYRVARQILEWVEVAVRPPYNWPIEKALDAEICHKILPRLQVGPYSDAQMRMFQNLMEYFEEAQGFSETLRWFQSRKERLEKGEAISGQQ
jgi:hypothetical protein